jgi:hypothetical protein
LYAETKTLKMEAPMPSPRTTSHWIEEASPEMARLESSDIGRSPRFPSVIGTIIWLVVGVGLALGVSWLILTTPK